MTTTNDLMLEGLFATLLCICLKQLGNACREGKLKGKTDNQQLQHGGQLKKPMLCIGRIDKITFTREKEGKQQMGHHKVEVYLIILKLHLSQWGSTECNEQKEISSFQLRFLYSFLPKERQAVTHRPKLAAINSG